MHQCGTWGRVPLGLRRVVGRWLCKRPRLIQNWPIQGGTAMCLAQIGSRIFAGLNNAIQVFDEAEQRWETWYQSPDIIDTPGYIRPFGLAVSSRDELLVLDYAEQCIKVLDVQGTLRRKFGCFVTELECLCTAPHDDRVVVGTGTRMYVLRQSDGVRLHTWPLDLSMQNTGLCLVPELDLVLVSMWNPDGIDALRVSDGQLVHRWNNDTCGPRTFQSPQDVLLWQDRLFVANAASVDVLRLCDGKPLLMLDLPLPFGLFFPTTLLITRAGQLWVAASDCSGIFVFDLRET